MKKPLKIVVTGPESSGKTTLCRQLAEHFGAPKVDEHARHYLQQLQRPYRIQDITAIGKEQLILQHQAILTAKQLLFCDTGLLVLNVWSAYRYERVDPWLQKNLLADKVAVYLLCRPDIPWEYDPLRENRHDRDELFAWYQRALDQHELPYSLIEGASGEERLQSGIAVVERLLNLS